MKGGVVRLKRLNFNADDVDSRQVESRESRVACGVFSFRLKSADGILGAALFVPLGAARRAERGGTGRGGGVGGLRMFVLRIWLSHN